MSAWMLGVIAVAGWLLTFWCGWRCGQAYDETASWMLRVSEKLKAVERKSVTAEGARDAIKP